MTHYNPVSKAATAFCITLFLLLITFGLQIDWLFYTALTLSLGTGLTFLFFRQFRSIGIGILIVLIVPLLIYATIFCLDLIIRMFLSIF
jgi:hypothetical protein